MMYFHRTRSTIGEEPSEPSISEEWTLHSCRSGLYLDGKGESERESERGIRWIGRMIGREILAPLSFPPSRCDAANWNRQTIASPPSLPTSPRSRIRSSSTSSFTGPALVGPFTLDDQAQGTTAAICNVSIKKMTVF